MWKYDTRSLRSMRAYYRGEQDHDPHYVKPKQDGYYWLYHQKYGSMVVWLHKHGYWHDPNLNTMEHMEIVEGPLPYPTRAQINSQPEHFEAARRQEWGGRLRSRLAHRPDAPLEPSATSRERGSVSSYRLFLDQAGRRREEPSNSCGVLRGAVAQREPGAAVDPRAPGMPTLDPVRAAPEGVEGSSKASATGRSRALGST